MNFPIVSFSGLRLWVQWKSMNALAFIGYLHFYFAFFLTGIIQTTKSKCHADHNDPSILFQFFQAHEISSPARWSSGGFILVSISSYAWFPPLTAVFRPRVPPLSPWTQPPCLNWLWCLAATRHWGRSVMKTPRTIVKKLLSVQVPGRGHAKPGRQFYGQKRLYFWIICILCIRRTFWHILYIFHIIAYHTLKWQGLWFAGHSADTLFT